MIIRIVSGGQTGADQGGLEAAIYCDIPHGGWCPKGRKSEAGRIPDKYQLQEMSSADYLKRTEANVIDSDATIVFTQLKPTGGSLRTIEFCIKHRKPSHHVAIDVTEPKQAVQKIADWLEGRAAFDYGEYVARPPKECVLNVAGSRESKMPGIEDAVQALMVDVIGRTNKVCYYPLAKSKGVILQ